MGQISLQIMTRELCHDLYKGWTNDASIYMDMKLFKPYTYNEDAVNRYFDEKLNQPLHNSTECVIIRLTKKNTT